MQQAGGSAHVKVSFGSFPRPRDILAAAEACIVHSSRSLVWDGTLSPHRPSHPVGSCAAPSRMPPPRSFSAGWSHASGRLVEPEKVEVHVESFVEYNHVYVNASKKGWAEACEECLPPLRRENGFDECHREGVEGKGSRWAGPQKGRSATNCADNAVKMHVVLEIRIALPPSFPPATSQSCSWKSCRLSVNPSRPKKKRAKKPQEILRPPKK